MLWTYVISDLNGQKLVGTFYEKEFQKTNQTELKKYSQEKGIINMSDLKAMIICLLVG